MSLYGLFGLDYNGEEVDFGALGLEGALAAAPPFPAAAFFFDAAWPSTSAVDALVYGASLDGASAEPRLRLWRSPPAALSFRLLCAALTPQSRPGTDSRRRLGTAHRRCGSGGAGALGCRGSVTNQLRLSPRRCSPFPHPPWRRRRCPRYHLVP